MVIGMPRTMPDYPGDINVKDLGHHPGMVARTYDIEVITPMFGGGVDAGKIDPEHPIRESSIRGHLRFWWRATRGAGFSDVRELRQREGEIWGSTENPSPVEIGVTLTKKTQNAPCRYVWQMKKNGNWDWILQWLPPFDSVIEIRQAGNGHLERRRPLPYALFPFQGKKPEEDGKPGENRNQPDVITSARFLMKISFADKDKMAGVRHIFNQQREKKGLRLLTNPLQDDIENDVCAAIWAWVNFGGIGARTRRGCGALYCVEPKLAPANIDSIKQSYGDALVKYEIPTAATNDTLWPTIPEKILIKLKSTGGPIGCWVDTIDLIREFRQGVLVGRNRIIPPKKSPGRSWWPEAESLRNIAYGGNPRSKKPGQNASIGRPGGIHAEDPKMVGIKAFPRAEFGMPIILEIRGEGIKPTIQPTDENDRMASPLILRPLKCNDGSSCVPMIMRLKTPRLLSAYVKSGQPSEDNSPSFSVSRNEIADASINSKNSTSPMIKRSADGSALDAFLVFVQEFGRDFKEVP